MLTDIYYTAVICVVYNNFPPRDISVNRCCTAASRENCEFPYGEETTDYMILSGKPQMQVISGFKSAKIEIHVGG